MNKNELIEKLTETVSKFNLSENFELRVASIELFISKGDTQQPVSILLMGSDVEYNKRLIEYLEAQANMQHDVKKEGFYA